MDDWRIEGVAVCAGIEDTVSGVGEEVVEGVGERKVGDKKAVWNISDGLLN